MEFAHLALSGFRLEPSGLHGLPHWRRVEKIGLYLADHSGADKQVVRLFAYLHDSQRQEEDGDLEHGLRAATYAQELYDAGHLSISLHQLGLLKTACQNHNIRRAVVDNPTVQTCLDADRLDLWRVGETPDSRYLYTEISKCPQTLEFSRKLFLDNEVSMPEPSLGVSISI